MAIDWLQDLDSKVQAAIIGGIISLVVSVITSILVSQKELKKIKTKKAVEVLTSIEEYKDLLTLVNHCLSTSCFGQPEQNELSHITTLLESNVYASGKILTRIRIINKLDTERFKWLKKQCILLLLKSIKKKIRSAYRDLRIDG